MVGLFIRLTISTKNKRKKRKTPNSGVSGKPYENLLYRLKGRNRGSAVQAETTYIGATVTSNFSLGFGLSNMRKGILH